MSVHRTIATKDGVSNFALQLAIAMDERTRPVPAGHLALSGNCNACKFGESRDRVS
jgi:hypothetical protein